MFLRDLQQGQLTKELINNVSYYKDEKMYNDDWFNKFMGNETSMMKKQEYIEILKKRNAIYDIEVFVSNGVYQIGFKTIRPSLK